MEAMVDTSDGLVNEQASLAAALQGHRMEQEVNLMRDTDLFGADAVFNWWFRQCHYLSVLWTAQKVSSLLAGLRSSQCSRRWRYGPPLLAYCLDVFVSRMSCI